MPNNLPTSPKIAYSIRESCQALSVGKTTIYKMLSDPHCPLRAVRIGRRTVIPADVLHAVVAIGG